MIESRNSIAHWGSITIIFPKQFPITFHAKTSSYHPKRDIQVLKPFPFTSREVTAQQQVSEARRTPKSEAPPKVASLLC